MEQKRVEIGKPHNGGFLDEAFLNESGILRIVGWAPGDDTPPPQVQGATHLWTLRFDRRDIEAANRGLYHDYLISGRAAVILCEGEFPVTRTTNGPPPYAHLLKSEKVMKRANIYGTGPSVPFVDAQVQNLLAEVKGRVLDFGCGSGATVAHLNATGRDATGIDLDTPKIRANVLPSASECVLFYDGGRLPFDDGEFDWAVSTEVIEHIDNCQDAITELARVSSSLVMTVPDATGIPRLSGIGVVPWHLLEATHFNFFSPRSLRALLEPHFKQVVVGQLHNTRTESELWSVNLFAIATNP